MEAAGLTSTTMKKSILAATVLAQASGAFWEGNGRANEESIVHACSGDVRLTVLTPSIVRMEYKLQRDEQTFAFINRKLPYAPFEVTKNDENGIILETEKLSVNYQCNTGTFRKDNIKVTVNEIVNGTQPTWHGGTNYEGNLFGTVRTLDGLLIDVDLDCENQKDRGQHCTYGVISKAGYVVIDDTLTPNFSGSGSILGDPQKDWPWTDGTDGINHPSSKAPKGGAVKRSMQQDGLLHTGENDYIDLSRTCGFQASTSENVCNSNGCQWFQNTTMSKCYYGPDQSQDLYFFGHGHDYKLALHEFSLLSGKIPLPPRYSLGLWYSRYWAYSDGGIMDIVDNYVQNSLPLDVTVVDMDWHITHYKTGGGWTGFTWDRHLFPDSKGFLDWCKAHRLKNTLNLHPADGMQKWEERFNEVAEFLHLDPNAIDKIPFNGTDVNYMDAWLHLVLKPLADQGIDVWWLDWQQGEDVLNKGNVNPTWWLNYLLYTDPLMWNSESLDPKKRSDGDSSAELRPMILHRWGGLGNHRMQLGFSGDVVPSFFSLNFEIYFTATAANVLYGFWSHDIGGHTMPSPPELYTRWVQFGVLSPVFRTHCTKNYENTRAIWMYPPENFSIMRQSFQFRARLNPYLYTTIATTHTTSISMVHPMYYDYPDMDDAYSYKYQYMLGDDLLVSPVGSPVSTATGLASKATWFPPGEWVSFDGLFQVTGPTELVGEYTLAETPLFAKVGSIIPMKFDSEALELGSAEQVPMGYVLKAFVCESKQGHARVYDDDGKSVAFDKSDAFAWTSFDYIVNDQKNHLDFTIGAMDGDFEGAPSKRHYQIVLSGVYPASLVTVDGKKLKSTMFIQNARRFDADTFSYDGETLSLVINVSSKSTKHKVAVHVESMIAPGHGNPLSLCSLGFPALMKRLFKARDTIDSEWGKAHYPTQEDYSSLLTLAETGKRITYNPSVIVAELGALTNALSESYNQLLAADQLDDAVKKMVIAQVFNKSM